MELAKIEQNVVDLLNLSGIENEGLVVQQTLHHMLMCVKLYETLDAEQRERVAKWRKHFQFLIDIKFNLKERKGRKDKKNSPSYSPIKEKPQEAKAEKTLSTVCDPDSGFDEDLLERLRAFEKECEKYVGKYGRTMVDDFIRYWTLPNQTTGRMRFEEQRYWRLSSKLKSWQTKSFTLDDAAAAMRLTKTRKQQAKEQAETAQQRERAAEREAANARREQEREAAKAGAVSYEEWKAMKEQTTDCTD
jgi:hypothetical protein